ncbi:30S ribosome-binding factor RbfA [Tessaracoccus sp. HF-7]|nr:30S ribosome-binding factor RbfA [Tessaracoccus caeni]MDF1486742.1 30S ribosome-binding factor RbfA [Tessaracoccus caeni]
MPGSSRNAKLADQIKVIIASTLDRRVKDPRLGFVTITEVRLSGDNREATAFYTVLGDEDAQAASAAALRSATGMLRTAVGTQLGLRHTPSLEFVRDAIPETAKEIDELLAKVHASDAELAKAAEAATFAGEADPYRKPREDDEE